MCIRDRLCLADRRTSAPVRVWRCELGVRRASAFAVIPPQAAATREGWKLSLIHILANAVFEKKADMVVGDRLSSSYFTENKRPFHNIGNVMVRRFINSFFKSDIKDIMTGYRAFSYEFVKNFPVLSKGFEIETETVSYTHLLRPCFFA